MILHNFFNKLGIDNPVKKVRRLPKFRKRPVAYTDSDLQKFFAECDDWERAFFSLVLATGLRRGGDRLYCVGLSLILGGALGNLCDRVTLGKVVDFLSLHHYIPFRHPLVAWLDPFPAFNIADSAITIGAALLILDGFRRRPDRPAAVR